VLTLLDPSRCAKEGKEKVLILRSVSDSIVHSSRIYYPLSPTLADSRMHPLPPPPKRTAEDQTAPTRPSVAPLQDTSAHPEQSGHSPSQAAGQSENIKKKRRHRGKKSKRTRRQSFAAPSEASLQSAIPEVMTEHHAGDRSNSGARQSFYRLGRSGGNLSNTSFDSEALLDHR
jgi:magnesium transporter